MNPMPTPKIEEDIPEIQPTLPTLIDSQRAIIRYLIEKHGGVTLISGTDENKVEAVGDAEGIQDIETIIEGLKAAVEAVFAGADIKIKATDDRIEITKQPEVEKVYTMKHCKVDTKGRIQLTGISYLNEGQRVTVHVLEEAGKYYVILSKGSRLSFITGKGFTHQTLTPDSKNRITLSKGKIISLDTIKNTNVTLYTIGNYTILIPQDKKKEGQIAFPGATYAEYKKKSLLPKRDSNA